MTSTENTPAVATTPCPSDGEVQPKAERLAPLQSPDTSSLRGAVERATPGPWHTNPKDPEESFFSDVNILRHDGLAVAVAVHNGDIEPETVAANAALIVAAVNALPWLIARSEQADRLDAECEASMQTIAEERARAEAAEAKVSTLTDALKDLLALPVAVSSLALLDKGIGTSTLNAAWLRARQALSTLPPSQEEGE